jgi:hypothetical protein
MMLMIELTEVVGKATSPSPMDWPGLARWWGLALLGLLALFFVGYWLAAVGRRSATGGFFLAVFRQLRSHWGVFAIIFAVSLLLLVVSSWTHHSTDESRIEQGLLLTLLGALATFAALINTYYIMHGLESRVFDYNRLLDRLTLDLDGIIGANRGRDRWLDDFVYVMAYTPLLGSISADERRYELYRNSLQQVVRKVDSVFVRVKDYEQFHTRYSSALSRFQADLDPTTKAPKPNTELTKFIEARDLHVVDLLRDNESSKLDDRQHFDNCDTPLDQFPPYYVYVSRSLTAICLLRYEPRIGNEIVGLVSEERFYRDFAYELFPPNCRDELRRIKP